MNVSEMHPNDIRLFKTVVDVMTHVAKEYQLPLASVEALPKPEYGETPFGRCFSDGRILIVLRGMRSGVWDLHPFDEHEIWDTAAHELAHLRYRDHGDDFQEFHHEMEQALKNRRENYAAKVLERLVKMQDMREGFARMGSDTEAEAFAGMINKMLIDNELNPSDLDYARGMDNDPVVEIECDLSKYPMDRHSYDLHGKKSRIAWQEQLAGIVSYGHLCTFAIVKGTNRVVFIGTKSHATVAEYCYGNLVRAATSMSFDARIKYHRGLQKQGLPSTHGRGFRESWIAAFVQRIAVRLLEARKAAVAEVSSDRNVQSQALMRLNGALVKTQHYMQEKFGKTKSLNALPGGKQSHREGSAMGLAAADSLNIGQKGIGKPRDVAGHLGE